MSNSPLPQNQLIHIDQQNLMLLHMLYEQNDSFALYAKSINELFYFYVQHCTEKGEDLFLTQADIQRILEVVNTFLQLQDPLLE